MKTAIRVLLTICFVLAFNTAASTQTAKEVALPNQTVHATGFFDVKVTPQPADETAGSPALARMLLDKHFHGDLEATSKGTMLAAGSGAKGSSGGYVALEVVTATLKGRTGTFILQHSGTMTHGTPTLSVTVVPDSGTGQLTDLAGKMSINITNGKHSYDLEYTLPETQ
ncbi:DUF3224 domain-containing protein [Tunturiibacter gelidiferens]|uniref:DUF3224 domain-containing protein n=1 Tax=Tunturiibacter gelidiferens TaxID=3069689 RepID=UPI003D9B3818